MLLELNRQDPSFQLMSSPTSNSNPAAAELKEIPDLSRYLVEIVLEKDATNGFGFNIVGGIESPHIPGHSGIFISKIRPDGPAAKDGRLRPGDRIVQVNDVPLTLKTHSEAVEIFREATGKVRFLIEQDAEAQILCRPSDVVPSPLTESPAQSTYTAVDDVPRTPKKPVSIFDPASPSLITEAIFISIGAVSIGLCIALSLRYFRRR